MCEYGGNQRKLCDAIKCKICLEKSFKPDYRSKFLIDNIDPRMIFKLSNKKYRFKCDICEHIWADSLSHIVGRDSWCPYCSSKKLCDNQECKKCFEKSFKSNIKSQSLDEDVDPRFIFNFSNKKYKFKCKKCDHKWKDTICHITRDLRWCPYCSNKKLCKNKCKKCFKLSFASTPNCKLLEDKVDPRMIFKCAVKKYNFRCSVCDHVWKCSLDQMTTRKTGCPYCAHKVLCKKECQRCFDKSFKPHFRSQFLYDKVDATQIFKVSGKKYNFKCEICDNIFKMAICDITGKNSWCPKCGSGSSENICRKLLENISTLSFVKCRPLFLKKLELDGYNEEYQIAFEYNGRQHFEFIPHFHRKETSFKDQQDRDKTKRELLKKHNIDLIDIDGRIYNYQKPNKLKNYLLKEWNKIMTLREK